MRALARGGGLRPGALVAHCSGAHTLELLQPAREAGALRAVIQPLQSVPSMEAGVANIPGSSFRVEADEGGLPLARRIVQAVGGVELALPLWGGDRDSAALYHAGAVAVSNYLVALLAYGLGFYERLGADRAAALRAVLPLVRGTVAKVERLGIPAALTRPIARGDARTVAGHLEAHNSGHWTIEGSVTSQFENHLRAVTGLPLGSTASTGHSAMVNLVGSLPDPASVLAIEEAHLHLYDKAPRPGRKVGHVTVVSGSLAGRDVALAHVARFLSEPVLQGRASRERG